jgi:hypothetical protein
MTTNNPISSFEDAMMDFKSRGRYAAKQEALSGSAEMVREKIHFGGNRKAVSSHSARKADLYSAIDEYTAYLASLGK